MDPISSIIWAAVALVALAAALRVTNRAITLQETQEANRAKSEAQATKEQETTNQLAQRLTKLEQRPEEATAALKAELTKLTDKLNTLALRQK